MACHRVCRHSCGRTCHQACRHHSSHCRAASGQALLFTLCPALSVVLPGSVVTWLALCGLPAIIEMRVFPNLPDFGPRRICRSCRILTLCRTCDLPGFDGAPALRLDDPRASSRGPSRSARPLLLGRCGRSGRGPLLWNLSCRFSPGLPRGDDARSPERSPDRPCPERCPGPLRA